MRDTIYALATAPGRAAVAIVRVSGPQSRVTLKALCGAVPAPREAALRKIKDKTGALIDEGLVIWFPAPGSFTGEDVFELQVHGGPAVIDAVTRAIDGLGGRLAEPGEFTRRAFEAGRLDLAQAEAVADLVDAETDAQRRQALRQLGGELFQRGARWREILIGVLAFLNAQIDFPDEDLPDDIAARAVAPLEALVQEIDQALEDVRGERIRDGLRIALIGPPNAGKSSLFNALVKRDAAIVTAIPGTTRDVIEAPLILGGYKAMLADTAGVRVAADEVEAEGVRRATAWAQQADLRILALDPSEPNLDAQIMALIKIGDVLAMTKSDLLVATAQFQPPSAIQRSIRTSVFRDGGTDELVDYLDQWAIVSLGGSDFPAVTRIRHRRLLEDARRYILNAQSHTMGRAEVIAADVQQAMLSLESIAGRVDVEAILDRVFASFCIGK